MEFWPYEQVKGATGFSMNMNVHSECVHQCLSVWILCFSMSKLIHDWNYFRVFYFNIPLFFYILHKCVMTVCFLLLSHWLWFPPSLWSVAQKQQCCNYWWGSLINNSAIHLISQWDWWWSSALNSHTSILYLALGCCYLSLQCISAFSVFVSAILSVALSALRSLSAFFLSFLFFPVCLFCYLSLSPSNLFCSNHFTLQISHCLTLLSLQVTDTCVTGCHFVLLTSTGGKCHSGWKTSENSRKGMEARLQWWVCVTGKSGETEAQGEGDRLSQWVFGWNREPFPGQWGSIPTLPALTTPMSTEEVQEVKCVYICAWVNHPSFSLFLCVFAVVWASVCLCCGLQGSAERQSNRKCREENLPA